MDSFSLELVLIAVAILLNGPFSGAEIALVSSRIARLTQLRSDGRRGAAAALRLKEVPGAFLATIQIGITLVGTLASAVGGVTAAQALAPRLGALGLGELAEPVALGLVIVVITYASLVVGELVPKAIALRDPERLACRVAPVVWWLSRVSVAIVRGLTASTTGILRVLGQHRPSESPFVSEDEVRYLVREGAAKGIFEKVEEELVHNVFEFGDTTAREIMVPRQAIRGLEIDTPPAEVVARAAAIGHSRIPVYRASEERIEGFVLIKDVLRAAAAGTPPILRQFVRPPRFVPEHIRISALLKDLQRARQKMAFVVDEYGSVVGLVTAADILGEIVGEISEEGDAVAPPVGQRIPGGVYVLEGLALVRDVRGEFGLPLPDSDAYTTVAGFVLYLHDAIPTPGVSVVSQGYRWTVLEMAGPRIVKVQVEPVPSPTRGKPPASPAM